MESREREQTVKDLQEIVDNYSGSWQRFNVLNNALTLIKELTADVERVSKQCGEIIVECDERDAERLRQVGEYAAKVKDLTEEIKDLEAEYDRVYEQAEADIRGNMADGGTSCHWCMDKTKADTVRKIQDRLDKHFCHDPAFIGIEQRLIMSVVDRIAKEMLEEKNDV